MERLKLYLEKTIMSQTPKESGRRPLPGTPRWVKVFGIIAIILIALFVIAHLTGISPMGH